MANEPSIQTTDLNAAFQALRNSDPSKVSKQNIPNHPDYKRIPSQNYGPIASVNTGNWGNGNAMTRSAQSITYGQPQFFSPIHTAINWQLPSKNLEINQWCRFFYCLTPDNKILMADGTEKKICEIVVGDKIIDENGNAQSVLKVHSRNIDEKIIELTLNGKDEKISITKSHEIKVIKKEDLEHSSSKATWLEVKDVKIGDRMISPSLKNGIKAYSKIANKEYKHYSGIVYDLEVENNHTYCVNGCVVHNSNEPKVAAAVDFYSQFPLNDYTHECKDRKVKLYFDALKKRIDLNKWTRLIAHELVMLGNCFAFLEINCTACGGSGKIGDEICEHEGATIKRLILLNPDNVEVQSTPMNPDPLISLKPNEELMTMVQKKMPGYEKLDPNVAKLIAAGRPIRLDNRNIFHLKHGESGYAVHGEGMIRRLFPILSYKTKIMVAQWIIAERLILPIKIVKVGSDERPAGPADIASVQAQLAQTANDPSLTLVTHHNFDLEYYGACYSSDTEVLTENGWKLYKDVSKNYDEKIATYNLGTDSLEYDVPQEYHEYDFNGDMVRFNSDHVDTLVTPNHNMLSAIRKWNNNNNNYDYYWGKVQAQNICHNTKFKSSVENWVGEIPSTLPYANTKLNCLSLEDFLTFAGYYVSEGNLKIYKNRANGVTLSQKITSKSYLPMKELMNKIIVGFGNGKVSEAIHKNQCSQMTINNTEFGEELRPIFGVGSTNKILPRWILNLPKKYLKIVLQAMMDGDGNTRNSDKNQNTRYKYTTTSIQLANQVQEIVLKLGYFAQIHPEKQYGPVLPNRSQIYRVYWSELSKERNRTIRTERNIANQQYNGKVWCFTVKNGFFVTRRNGKIGIHGNSGKILQISNEFEFISQEINDGLMISNELINGSGPSISGGQAGIEAMVQRLESFRNYISDWIENFIYLPEAKRQGFITHNEDTDQDEYIVPTIKWNKMHLRDQQQDKQFAMQLYEKGLLSAHTMLEIFGYDPDMEVERKRYDSVQMMALGQGQGQQGGAAGGMGGGGGGGLMGDLGGMGGGGPELGGAGGGMGGEAGGAPISAPAGGGEAPAVTKATTFTAEVADISQFGGRVLKQKTRDKIQNEQVRTLKQNNQAQAQNASNTTRDEKGRIIFTKPERDLIGRLQQAQKDGIIKYSIIPQFKMQMTDREYLIDFAIPQLKLGIEADGEMFHSNPKQKQHDKERDMKLAQCGWTILRFMDTEIEKKSQQVIATITQAIVKKEEFLKNSNANIEKKQL